MGLPAAFANGSKTKGLLFLIDLTWKLATGAPAGPFRIIDTVGLKTCYDIMIMDPKYKEEDSAVHKAAVMLKEKIEKGENGVSAEKGFFDYKD